MSSKKIWQYPEATSITNDDYILMDSNTETGSQCLKANKIGAVHITKTVTERKVYKASDDNANGFSEVTVAVPYTDVHYDKDDIVSFVGEDLPLKSVTAYIEPQQDLHGYDAPWAGGAGKNKCGEFELGTLSESSTQGSTYDNMKVSNTARIRSKTLIEIPSTCTISCASGYQYAFAGYDSNMEYLGVYQFYTWRSEAYTFDNSTIKYIAIIIKRGDEGNIQSNDYTNCHIQLESGNQATSFAPYSNICPISGWSAVDVGVSGVNVWDEEWEVGRINATTGENAYGNGIRSKNKISIKPSTEYRALRGSYSDASSIIIYYYDVLSNYISYESKYGTNTVFTTPSNAAYIRFNIQTSEAVTYNNDISINYPSTDTEYHAYNGHTYTIDLDGTRYGGTLDVVNGVLTVDMAEIDLGSRTYNKAVDGYFYAYISDISIINFNANEPTAECEIYKLCTSDEWYGRTIDSGIFGVESSHVIYIADTRFSDGDSLKTALVGKKLVYTLATPLTIQLTPTQVNSLLGINNVWADTGEIAVEWQTLYVTPTT